MTCVRAPAAREPSSCPWSARMLRPGGLLRLRDRIYDFRPADAPGFIVAQLLGAAASTLLFRWLVPSLPTIAPRVVDRAENATPDSVALEGDR